tara:strand:+ start:979 stop:2307 length:1329 start_codon:yes stop_codon:yes gene_type:complete
MSIGSTNISFSDIQIAKDSIFSHTLLAGAGGTTAFNSYGLFGPSGQATSVVPTNSFGSGKYFSSSTTNTKLHDNSFGTGAIAIRQNGTVSTSLPLGFAYEFNSAQTITMYRIWAGNITFNKMIKNWELRGSVNKNTYVSNNSGTYTVLHTISNETSWIISSGATTASSNIGFSNKYYVTSPGSYIYYVLHITANNGETYATSIGEWALYKTPTTTAETNISLSSFRKLPFSSGNPIPHTGEISINDDFKNRTIALSTLSGDLGQVQLFSGNQGTSLRTYTKDLSNFGTNSTGDSLIGKKVHIYLRYVSGNGFRNDPQLFKITLNGIEHSPGLIAGPLSYTNWHTTYRTTNTSYNHNSTWLSVTSSTSPTGRWHRDTFSTPSGRTGVNVGSTGAIYYEGSSGGYNKDVYLRSPPIELTSGEVILKMYGYGSNIGTMHMGVYIL